MKFKKYYIEDKNGKSNCVIRRMCKVLNKKYDDVYNNLCKIAEELKCFSYNDIPVFEKYMEKNNIIKIDFKSNTMIKDLILDNNTYVIFCYDKKGYYHMVPIINNTIFDKKSDCLNLYVISVYKKEI